MVAPVFFTSISREQAKTKIAKAIAIGCVKGVIQYLLVFASISTALDYVSGSILSSTGGSSSISGLPISIEFDMILLIMFIGLSVVSSLIKEFILYGPVIGSIITIILLYVVFVKFGWGVVDLTIGSYGSVHLDLTPIFERIFNALVLAVMGSGFLGLSKNLKK